MEADGAWSRHRHEADREPKGRKLRTAVAALSGLNGNNLPRDGSVEYCNDQ